MFFTLLRCFICLNTHLWGGLSFISIKVPFSCKPRPLSDGPNSDWTIPPAAARLPIGGALSR